MTRRKEINLAHEFALVGLVVALTLAAVCVLAIILRGGQ